jgi:hypothetical protein
MIALVAGFVAFGHFSGNSAAPTEAELLKRVVASVVTIQVDRVRGNKTDGSGFFVSSDGLLLTNAHVVTGAVSASGALANGAQESAQPVAIDRSQDIAELQLASTGSTRPPALTFAQQQPLLGDNVYVIGNPLGALPGTVTKGRVSGLGRDSTVRGTSYHNLIQLDISASPGNSGGPVINTRGEVVGMLTLGVSGTNQALAIPASALTTFRSTWKGASAQAFEFPLVTAGPDQLFLDQTDLPGFVVATGQSFGGVQAIDINPGQAGGGRFAYANIEIMVLPTVAAAQAEFAAHFTTPYYLQLLHERVVDLPINADQFQSITGPDTQIGGGFLSSRWRDRNVVVLVGIESDSATAFQDLTLFDQLQQSRLDDY